MTTYPHRINLREPWQAETLPDGRIVTRRAFNFPADLGPREDVWLLIAASTGLAGVRVNDFATTSDDDREGVGYSVTNTLRRHNVVELTLEPGGSRGDVYLEIRLLDYDPAMNESRS